MKANGIRSKVKKKCKATTNFKADKPNEKWVSDITNIPTKEGWIYLAGVMDLYGRGLVGWAMDSLMKTELVKAALKQAIGRTGAKEGVLVDSDRVVQVRQEVENILPKGFLIHSG